MSRPIVQSGRRVAACLAAMMACALLGAGMARGATYTVNSGNDAPLATGATGCQSTEAGGTCTLRAAVQAADAAGGASTITVPAGTYTLSIPSTGAGDPATGDLDIKDPSAGAPTSIAIMGAGSGTGGTTITAAQAGVPAAPIDRLFTVDNTDASLTLTGLAVSGGQPSALSTGAPNGGAIYSAGAFSAAGVTFRNNATAATGSGGAIDQAGSGALDITATTFDHNTAAVDGGAVADPSSANAVFAGSTFTANQTQTGAGGALSLAGSSYAIDNDEFDNNTAATSGGAIGWTHGTLTGRADAFVGNGAGADGGAILASATQPLSLTNVTLDGNHAQGKGGAAAFAAATPLELLNDTVWNNTATNPGSAIAGAAGVVAWRDGVQNTVFGATASSNTCDAPFPAGVDQGHNFETDSSCLTNQPHDVTDPRLTLGSPASNGGQVKTDAEPAGAASIDAGSNAVCPPQDARGVSRPQGAACDIGAYEFVPPPPPSSSPTTSTQTVTTTSTATSTVTTSTPAGTTAASGPPPSVTTRGVMAATPTTAFLGGTVDPHGEATQYSFQVGPTTAYGISTVSGTTDTGPLTVETRITGLKPGTLYHYRMVATSAGGTSSGADRTFRTPPPYSGTLSLGATQIPVHAGRAAVVFHCASTGPCLLRFTITVPVRLARTHKLGTLSFTRPSNPLMRIRAHGTVTLSGAVTPAGLALLRKARGQRLTGTLSTRPRSNQRGIVAPVTLQLR